MLKNIWKPSLVILTFVFSFNPALAASYGSSSASGKPVGFGFVVGDPTGLVLQLNANSANPVNLGAAYAWDHWFQFWGDYTFHYPNFVSNLVKSKSPIDAYIGIGAGILAIDNKYFNNSFGLLGRVPFGLEMKLQTAPIGFFLELVPSILFAPRTDFYFQGGIGLRFYF